MRLPRLLALAALILVPVSVEAAPTYSAPVPYVSARTITPGMPVPTGGAGVALACSGSGTVRLVFPNKTTLDVYAMLGTAMIDDMEITDVSAAASNAPCTVTVLYRTLPYGPL